MSYSFYKIAHLIGLASLLMGFGLGIVYFMAPTSIKKSVKILAFSLHGLGLALLLVTGFGLLARLGLTATIPAWVYFKIAIWLLMGLMISAVKRRPEWFPMTPILILFLAAAAAAIAVTKPF